MSICYLLDGETPPARQNGKRLPCERLYAEKEELQAENAHLWESVQNAEHEESVAWDMVRSAKRRNDKLRELVRDMCKAFMHGNCYRWCEFKEPCNYISDGRCQWYERARELGVEV